MIPSLFVVLILAGDAEAQVEELRWRSATAPAASQRWMVDPDLQSTLGLDRFRWGMGPGDVVALVPLPAGVTAYEWTRRGVGSTVLSGLSGELLVRVKVGATDTSVDAGTQSDEFETFFQFVDSELSRIHLTKQCHWRMDGRPSAPFRGTPPSSIEVTAWERWLRDTRASFDETYGTGRCVQWSNSQRCTWESLTGHVELDVSRSDFESEAAVRSATLSFSDLLRLPRPIRSTDASATTSTASWSKHGWTVFRWGMGIGDVENLLRSQNGAFRSTRSMACRSSESSLTEVSCTLERDFHSFRLVRLVPELVFGFVDGRLESARVEIVDELDRHNLQRVTETLFALLKEKYGAATADSLSGRDSRFVSWNTKQAVIRLALSPHPQRVRVEYTATKLALEADTEAEKL